MNRATAAILASSLSLSAWAAPDQPVEINTDADRLNYTIGYQIGGEFKGQPKSFNPDILMRGIQDALSGAQPQITVEQMRTSLTELKRQAQAQAQAERKAALDRMVAEGKAFLAENAKKDGVVTLPSGLQYKVVEPGTGKSPSAADTVTVDYRGTFIDGTEFDSSYKRGEPTSFPVEGVIPGWVEALQLMKEGAQWQLFIPPELAYGSRGQMAGRTLVFDVTLKAVATTQPEEDPPVEFNDASAKPDKSSGAAPQ